MNENWKIDKIQENNRFVFIHQDWFTYLSNTYRKQQQLLQYDHYTMDIVCVYQNQKSKKIN